MAPVAKMILKILRGIPLGVASRSQRNSVMTYYELSDMMKWIFTLPVGFDRSFPSARSFHHFTLTKELVHNHLASKLISARSMVDLSVRYTLTNANAAGDFLIAN
jgi:hypothetical protein